MTSQLSKEIKLYVKIACQLGYNMMLISIGICQHEGKYARLKKNICHISGPSPNEKLNRSLESHLIPDTLDWIFHGFKERRAASKAIH